jgi:hypothetical protein
MGMFTSILAGVPVIVARRGDGDEGSWQKIIPVAVILAFWLFGVIAKNFGKAKPPKPISITPVVPPKSPAAMSRPGQQRTFVRTPTARLAPSAVPAYRSGIKRPPAYRQQAAPIVHPKPAVPFAGPKKQRAILPAAPPVLVARAAASREQSAAAATSGKPAINAAAIRAWLTPAVMRKQYVLTELFDAPPGTRGREQA